MRHGSIRALRDALRDTQLIKKCAVCEAKSEGIRSMADAEKTA